MLASSGDPSLPLRTATEEALGGRSFRSKDAAGHPILAVPVRAGGRPIGALGVVGRRQPPDHALLSVLADAAAVAMMADPEPSPAAVRCWSPSPSPAPPRADAALAAVLDAAGPLFGASAGCTTSAPSADGTQVRLTAARGLDPAPPRPGE